MDERPKFNRRDFVRQGLKGLAGLAGELKHSESPAPSKAPVMAALAPFSVGDEEIFGYIARPEQPGSYPAILLIHELFGLVPHIKDIAVRFAREGYVAIAPDLYTREAPIENRRDLIAMRRLTRSIPDERFLMDLEATIEHLSVLTFVDHRRIASVGFCMGGLYSFLLSAQSVRLRAAVDFYGRVAYPRRTDSRPNAPIDVVENISCPILGIFGSSDHVVPVDDVKRLKNELMAKRKAFQIKIYPNAPHAFFNDTLESYRQDMAEDAWKRMLSFLHKHMK